MANPTQPAPATPFKRCTCCAAHWSSREEFLSDPDVALIGYQAHFEDLKTGFFLFNHACQTTMAIGVEAFLDLYQGPVFGQRATGGKNCLGYCLHRDELRACPVQCECAFVREIIQIVRNWPKRKVA